MVTVSGPGAASGMEILLVPNTMSELMRGSAVSPSEMDEGPTLLKSRTCLLQASVFPSTAPAGGKRESETDVVLENGCLFY